MPFSSVSIVDFVQVNVSWENSEYSAVQQLRKLY